MAPEEVKGGLKARVAQLLMMAAYQKRMADALRLAAKLMAYLTHTGGIDYMAVFVIYLAATQERKVVNDFAAQVRQHAPTTGGDMLTYAEELIQEGLRRGKTEGKIEGITEGRVQTIESLLAVGADWSLITRATGITPEEFQRLKEELKRFAAGSDADNLQPQP